MKALINALAAAALLLVASAVRANCGGHELTDASHLALDVEAVLIVTHGSSFYDARASSKRGIDEAVHFAKDRGMPVIYLQDDTPEQLYFMADCQPSHWVYSEGGELRFRIRPRQVFLAGGHLENCLSRTLHDLLEAWSRDGRSGLVVNLLMDAIYSNGKLIEASDPYRPEFDRFMRIITHGRPAGEHWGKLTLLETMGIIRKDGDALGYMERVLPHYERAVRPDHRVEVALNDQVVKVLRPGRGWFAPTLRFNFVESAAIWH